MCCDPILHGERVRMMITSGVKLSLPSLANSRSSFRRPPFPHPFPTAGRAGSCDLVSS